MADAMEERAQQAALHQGDRHRLTYITHDDWEDILICVEIRFGNIHSMGLSRKGWLRAVKLGEDV